VFRKFTQGEVHGSCILHHLFYGAKLHFAPLPHATPGQVVSTMFQVACSPYCTCSAALQGSLLPAPALPPAQAAVLINPGCCPWQGGLIALSARGICLRPPNDRHD
jgi:hypothetical protein